MTALQFLKFFSRPRETFQKNDRTARVRPNESNSLVPRSEYSSRLAGKTTGSDHAAQQRQSAPDGGGNGHRRRRGDVGEDEVFVVVIPVGGRGRGQVLKRDERAIGNDPIAHKSSRINMVVNFSVAIVRHV